MTVRDAETLELLREEPELLALADAVTATQRRRRRVPRRLLLAVAAAVAAALVALAAPWDDDDGGGLIAERALAALPARGPVLHTVLEHRYGTWVNLETGRARPLLLRSEFWYDEERGLLRTRAWREGRLLGDSTMANAGDSLDAAMVTSFADGAEVVRRALEEGRARFAGEGRVRGRDVYWLAATAREDDNGFDVAVDRRTYEFVQMRRRGAGETGEALTVVTFEYLPRREGTFGPPRPGGLGVVPGSGVGASVTEIRLGDARLALGRAPALWAGPSVGGRTLQTLQSHDVQADLSSPAAARGTALVLTYGPGAVGPPHPDSVVITQVRADGPAREYVGGEMLPPQGFAELETARIGTEEEEFTRWSARLQREGVGVKIEGPTRAIVLEVARTLRPIPADAD